MRARIPAALFLGLLLMSAAHPQTPGALQQKDPGKSDPKSDPKTEFKDLGQHKGSLMGEFKWPTLIGGKDIHAWLKDATTDPDPAVREFSLKYLPNFGPSARQVCAGRLLARMKFPSDGGEPDPGVRITLFDIAATIGFDGANDEREAIRILGVTANSGAPGGLARLHAVRTLGLYGSKAEGAVSFLVGPPCDDPAYETRRSVAHALGQIGLDETRGPNHKALAALSGTLARDKSAAVRMDALQSLVILGPPWAEARKTGDKARPKIDYAGAKVVADNMRARLVVPKGAKGPVEADKQLEIWCRIVLMTFDPKEINDENLNALTRHLDATDPGPKVQALQGLALIGEDAGKKIDDVLKLVVLDEKVKDIDEVNQLVWGTALNTLAAMGAAAKPAVDSLEKVIKRLDELKKKRMDQEEFKKQFLALKKEDQKLIEENLPEELLKKRVVATIDFIKKSKPGLPGGDQPAPPTVPEPKKG